MAEIWKSQRKLDEELKEYKHRRFEYYMEMEDRGEISRELAIRALREELLHLEEIDSEGV